MEMRYLGLLLAINVVQAGEPAHWAYAPISRPAIPKIEQPSNGSIGPVSGLASLHNIDRQ